MMNSDDNITNVLVTINTNLIILVIAVIILIYW